MSLPRRAEPLRLAREIPARLELVDAVCREIRQTLSDHGLETAVFGAELVARECLNNAVLHGSGSDPAKQVRLRLFRKGEWICLRVTDQGPGFDWQKARPNVPPDCSATSGRGLAIVKSYSERVRFNRQGNQITLWLKGPGADNSKAYG
jgi:serine/threonine-protein kinase RsbW